MRNITYSNARQNLSKVLDEVIDKHEPICIERRSGNKIVLIDADDYDSLMETAYLLKSPANVKRLLKALQEYQEQQGVEIDPQTYLDAKRN